jgi:hypothetical protein
VELLKARTPSTATAGDSTVDIRSKATDVSAAERDGFLEAVIRLKHEPATAVPAG